MILLKLIGSCCFIINSVNFTITDSVNIFNNVAPFCSSEKIVMHVYNATGALQLKITAHHVQYSAEQKCTWIVQPKISIVNESNIVVWSVTCDQAIFYVEKILILNGCVCINRIVDDKNYQSIITNYAVINLINQNMTTNNKTIIHGNCFYSVGSAMCVNLIIQKIKLFGNVYTECEF